MSSPGNASWCICVFMSPGSTAWTRSSRMLGGEDPRQLLERGLRRAVAAPALVGLDGGVGGDVEDHRALVHARERELGERERGDHVDGVDALELGERVGVQGRLRARAEEAGVVDEEVDPVAGGGDERLAVARVGDVAGQRVDGRALRQLRAGALEGVGAAGVDHEPVAAGGELAGEGEAEAARGAGDDRDGGVLGHATEATPGRAPRTIGNED